MAQEIYDDENSVVLPKTFKTWGQVVAVDRYDAFWDAGQHAHVRFDPAIHPANKKYGRIEIFIVPIDEMQSTRTVEYKSNTTSWGHEDWVKITRPTIKACFGVESGFLGMLLDRFFLVEQKGNGKMYEKKRDGVKTGEKAELTDFLFVKLFASMDACTADYLETKAGDPVTPASAETFPATDAPLNVPPVVAQAPDALLLKFAQAIVTSAAKNAPGDVTKITELVRAQVDVNPLLKGKFTTDSLEIQEMILAAVTA